MHNRMLDGQIVLVWQSGADYQFSFHDQSVLRLPPGKDWRCIGELTWEVEGDHFVHHLLPLQDRPKHELKELALMSEAHRAYREKLWRDYSIEERFKDLK